MVRIGIQALGLMVACAFSVVGTRAHAQENPQQPPAATPEEPVEAPTPITDAKALEARVKELERQLQVLTEQAEQEAMARLIQEAQTEAQAGAQAEAPEHREFLEGGLALQRLNPEITFSGDILAGLVLDGPAFYRDIRDPREWSARVQGLDPQSTTFDSLVDNTLRRKPRTYATESDRSGIPIREVGIHFQHELDPFSLFKSAFHITPGEGMDLEEVYIQWFGLIPGVSLAVGRFRQNFGVLNRWHEHDLDQTSYPMAL